MSLLNLIVLADSPDISVVDKLLPNLWAFITQLLAFIVLAIIVIRFGYKPVHNFIEKRREFVEDNLNSATKQNLEAQKANTEAKENLNKSRKEASAILMDVKKQAEDDKVKYEEELKAELHEKRIQAEKDIELEKQQALEEVKGQIVDIALSASSSLLQREVDKDDNRKLVKDFVDDVANENSSNDKR